MGVMRGRVFAGVAGGVLSVGCAVGAIADGGPGMMTESRRSPFGMALQGDLWVAPTESENAGQDVDLRLYAAEGWFDLGKLGAVDLGGAAGGVPG
ncbi:MAG: hypothetical protein AAGA57_09305, partial [Planctomycetota bacterium]